MARTTNIRVGALVAACLPSALAGWSASSASAQIAGSAGSGADAPAAASKLQVYAIHGQFTLTDQGNFGFKSDYVGANSLRSTAEGRETADATLFIGLRPWAGAELWINPEVDQGFGLTNTLGIAGFPSGEAYKVGAATPYFKLQRLFFRQTIDLGGETQSVDAGANQLAGSQTADRLVLTLGKISVVDIFDANSYAHDPRADFMNWSIIDSGTFDYAADAWGYSVGGAAEWYVGRWTLRGGLFNLSVIPNSPALEYNFSQYQGIGELEERHELGGRTGKLKVTWFITEGRMGRFDDAVALAEAAHSPADIAAVRRYRSRQGGSFNFEQAVSDTVGVFVHGGVADGSIEPYEFSDIDQTFSAGISVKGARWSRPDDTIGFAGAINGISKAHQAYLNAGGLGILVGDGKLPHPGPEQILETYYDIQVVQAAHVGFDYQFVDNPAYNRDRGPVSIIAARLHASF